MTTTRITALLVTLACVLGMASSAQARTPCPAETATATAANAGEVSDAIFCLTNQIRAAHGMSPLRRDARLDAAAALHSRDMGLRRFFDHDNPDGLSPGDRAAAQGYPSGVGENIAYGYPSARVVVLGWMASAGHCRNILGSAADIGVGTAVAAVPYYSQEFGDYYSRPAPTAPRNGCPYNVNLDTLVVPDPLPAAAPPASAPAAAPAAAPPTATTAATAATAARRARAKARAKARARKRAAARRARARLRKLSVAPRRFRTHGAAPRRGTTITYKLTRGASLTFRVQRAVGRGRYRTVGTMSHRGKAGVNRLRFSGRVGRRTLRPGSFRLRAAVRGAEGAPARSVVTRFTVTGR